MDLTTGKHTKHLKTPNEMIRAIAFHARRQNFDRIGGQHDYPVGRRRIKELRKLARPKEISYLWTSPTDDPTRVRGRQWRQNG